MSLACWRRVLTLPLRLSSVPPQVYSLAATVTPAISLQQMLSYRGAPPSPLPPPTRSQGLEKDYKVPVYSLESLSEVSLFTLPGDVFEVPIRTDIMQRVVRWQRAKKQQGTHKVKTRSERRGGGRKPRPQKGTGAARAGSIRAPQWRKGGRVHGPIPRSHAHKLHKKMRRLGLKSALSAKAYEGRLLLFHSLAVQPPKTKVLDRAVEELLKPVATRRSVLMIDLTPDSKDGSKLRRAAGNLPNVDVLPVIGSNVYSILQRDVLMMTTGAVEALVTRLRTPIRRGPATDNKEAAKAKQKAAKTQLEVAAEILETGGKKLSPERNFDRIFGRGGRVVGLGGQAEETKKKNKRIGPSKNRGGYMEWQIARRRSLRAVNGDGGDKDRETTASLFA